MIRYLLENGYVAKPIRYRFFPSRIINQLKKTNSLLIASVKISHGSHLVIAKFKKNNIEIFDP
jgi:hypothetical protein